jgi:hypothetical protein
MRVVHSQLAEIAEAYLGVHQGWIIDPHIFDCVT